MVDPRYYNRGLSPPAMDLPCDILLLRRSPRRLPTVRPIAHADQYLLVLALHGAGTAVINKIALRLYPRQALLVFPHQFHHFTGLSNHDFLWFFCSFRLVANREIIHLKDTPVPISRELWPIIQALADDYCSAQRLRPHILGRIAFNLWTLLLGLADAAPACAVRQDSAASGREIAFLAKLQDYLVNHLADRMTAERIAGHLGMSRRSLYQQFHDAMGLGLGAYIRRLRIQKACSLMNITDLTISQISAQIGYNSVFSFSRAFKHATRQTPTAYRAARAPENRGLGTG